MTAEAPNYSNLKQTADELWGDNGDRPTAPPEVTLAQAEVRAECRKTSRYDAGAIIAGKYQLLQTLGEGGMGSVWIAKNRTLDVDVAIKLMRAEYADDVDGIAERMLQEARAAACIGHPAIIQVFDFGFAEQGDPFIVMELLRGESLAQALRRRRCVSPERAVQSLLPIVDALGATHARGIVHRDLKPANIFLARPAGQRLQPKVLDFGVAKLERRAAERLTQEGALVGSPAYMAPEQLSGERLVDGRADIWSLCVVLYEMITGHRPFEGTSPNTPIWGAVMNSDPHPIAEHGLDEPALWQILKQGFAKKPEGRFERMQTLGRALAQWLIARGIQEDICDASLRSWLTPTDTGVQRVHSFFPSAEPGAGVPHVVVAAPVLQARRGALEASSTRRIAPAAHSPSKSTSSRNWFIGVAVAGATLAFIAAAALAGRTGPAAEHKTSRRVSVPERRTEPSVPQESTLPRDLEPTDRVTPVPTANRVRRPNPATSAPRIRRVPPSPPRRKQAQELKNPFD